ncbi:MAG: LysR family transcriptional regulator [Clostridiales bacterium]|nr:LysR family transcriptional regulator [Clostridiales bacterium]
MDTNVYRYVKVIAESESISAASRKLFISQPALTKQIGRLEEQLGIKLFERNKSPLKVTEAGHVFVTYAAEYIELEEKLKNELRRVAYPERRTVKVATTARGGSYIGNRTAAFLATHSDIQLEYLDMSVVECESALESEIIDLAIYTDPVISDKIEYMPLEVDPLVLAVPRNSKMLENKDISNNNFTSLLELTPEELRNPEITYVLSTENHSLYYAECNFLKKYKINPVQSLRVDFVDTRYSIACSGVGIVLVPTATIRENKDRDKMAYCTVKGESLYRYIVIAKKKGKILSQEAEKVWRFMIEQRF